MRWTFLIVILLSFIFFSVVARAEAGGEILGENGQPDLEKVRSIVSMAEMDWGKNDYIGYFDKMINLCQKLISRKGVNAADYMLFLDTASQVILKPHTTVKPHSIAFTNYERIANMLVPETLVLIQPSPESFSALRSRNTRLLMIVLSKARNAKIPNFNPNKPLFVNLAPPINPGNEPLIAGMDPAAIKNPEARAAYEKAIADNAKVAEERSEQQSIDKIIKHLVPRVEEYLVKVYSKNPLNDVELTEYMALGNFDAASSSKVIDDVHRQIGNFPEKK